MSDGLLCFRGTNGDRLVALGYDLDQRLAQWEGLRQQMVRGVADGFTRDEWAYLAGFLSRESLLAPFAQTFGHAAPVRPGQLSALIRPRGRIGIWLPNNVSLLGPLVLILASFTNSEINIKSGSRADDLSAAFVRYAINHLDDGELRRYLAERVQLARFDRDDPLNAAMAAASAVRIVFGTDAAAQAVNALPHPIDSVGISFADHSSEAWVEADAIDEQQLATLLRVFAIYGTAGCTSPRRLVLIDGSDDDCRRLRDRLLALWPSALKRDVPMNVASQNVLRRQLAAAAGWDAKSCARNAAVLAVGSLALPAPGGLMTLPIVGAHAEGAAATLPTNIQTVGHCLRESDSPRWMALLAATRIRRWVPVAKMHHFGPVWDGQNFWAQLFEEAAVDR
jgi:hypothetical protein